MATKEELFAAVRLIMQHCKEHDSEYCRHECPFADNCGYYFVGVPGDWPDPEEGGGEDGI